MVSTRSSTRQTRSGASTASVPTHNGSRATASPVSKKRKPTVVTKPHSKRAKVDKTEKAAATTQKRGKRRGKIAGDARAGATKRLDPKRQVTLDEVVLETGEAKKAEDDDAKMGGAHGKEEGNGKEGAKENDAKGAKSEENNRLKEKDRIECAKEKGGNEVEGGIKEKAESKDKEVPKEKREFNGTNGRLAKETKDEGDGIEVTAEQKKKDQETTILEKGLIYFFFRPRVQTKHVSSLNDVQRSYMVLLPLPHGASLSDAPVKGDGKYRLIAIPKKRLPDTGRHERFLTFVEKPRITIQELKDTFLKSYSYETKTMGQRTTPAPRPVGEGVYAITRRENDRQSHLAYILTIPNEPNELQEDFGLRERGSFVISVRNPDTPAPAQVSIPSPANYPKDLMEEFRGLRWMAAHPKHLEYENAEILFIGEKGSLMGSVDQNSLAVLEKLEDEDEARVKGLDSSDTIFQDLEISKKRIPGVQGTWD